MKDSRVLEYGGIYFSCIHKENLREEFSLKDHALVYLSGGRLEISGSDSTMSMMPGDCVFIRKDRRITLSKSMAEDGTPYKAVTMTFRRPFLVDYYRRVRVDGLPRQAVRSSSPVQRIPSGPDISALFSSLMPYFRSGEKPDMEWLDMKMAEGLTCILRTDPGLYASIFDFSSLWKIDLGAFMEENFMAELSLTEFAGYTGRSLSSFNRDFRKLFGETPEKWLVKRRLQYARELLRTRGCRVHEAMSDAGFSNLSYFSRAYKEAFGLAPSKERSRK